MDKKPNVKSLKPTAFAGMMAARLKAVVAASDAPVPDLYDYPANRLARELHPAVQFLKVEAIDAHSPDMKTYTLAPDKAKGTTSLAWFSAGQYLVLGVNVDGIEAAYTDGVLNVTLPKKAAEVPASRRLEIK